MPSPNLFPPEENSSQQGIGSSHSGRDLSQAVGRTPRHIVPDAPVPLHPYFPVANACLTTSPHPPHIYKIDSLHILPRIVTRRTCQNTQNVDQDRPIFRTPPEPMFDPYFLTYYDFSEFALLVGLWQVQCNGNPFSQGRED